MYLIKKLAIFLFILSCSTVPVTGRKQLTIYPDSVLNHQSDSMYYQLIYEERNQRRLVKMDDELYKKLNGMSARIEKGVEQYFIMEGWYLMPFEDETWWYFICSLQNNSIKGGIFFELFLKIVFKSKSKSVGTLTLLLVVKIFFKSVWYNKKSQQQKKVLLYFFLDL